MSKHTRDGAVTLAAGFGVSESPRARYPAAEPLADALKLAFVRGLPVPPLTERHLAAALAETLGRQGSMMRAQLAYRVGVAYGLREETATDLATTLEYFHAASLLFDDLPSMDDATHRRGAICIHRIYGEGTAILTALSLINRAYALLWRVMATMAPERQGLAQRYVEEHLGLGGLLHGQSLDLHYATLPEAERRPQAVALGKTVALIRLSLVLPAMVGGAPARAVQWLERLAVLWGLAYQALDDLKDVLHAPEEAGKTTMRDSTLDRPNLALALGTEAALRRLRKMIALSETVVDRLQVVAPAMVCLNAPRERLRLEVASFDGALQEVGV